MTSSLPHVEWALSPLSPREDSVVLSSSEHTQPRGGSHSPALLLDTPHLKSKLPFREPHVGKVSATSIHPVRDGRRPRPGLPAGKQDSAVHEAGAAPVPHLRRALEGLPTTQSQGFLTTWSQVLGPAGTQDWSDSLHSQQAGCPHQLGQYQGRGRDQCKVRGRSIGPGHLPQVQTCIPKSAVGPAYACLPHAFHTAGRSPCVSWGCHTANHLV